MKTTKNVVERVLWKACDSFRGKIDTFEEELIDIDEVRKNIASIEAELKEVQTQMHKYLKELGL